MGMYIRTLWYYIIYHVALSSTWNLVVRICCSEFNFRNLWYTHIYLNSTS